MITLKHKSHRPVHKALLATVAACFLQVISVALFAADWGKELQSADNLRTIDPALFSKKIIELNANLESFTPEQVEYFEYLQGFELVYQGKLSKANAILSKLSDSAEQSEIGYRANLTLANIHAVQRNWAQGLTSLNRALEMEGEITDPKLLELTLGIAGVFYNQIGQFEKGLYFANKLQQLYQNSRSQCVAGQLRLESLINIGENNIDELYRLTVKTCELAEERVIRVVVKRLYIQYVLETLKDPHLAHSILSEDLKSLLSSGYEPITLIIKSLMAKTYWELGKIEDAYKAALDVVNSPAANSTLEASIRANKVLVGYFRTKGDTKAALATYIKYAEADKAYLDEVKTKHLAFQLAQHQSLEQQNQIHLLNEQNKLLTLQRQLDRAEQYNSRIMIAVLFCMILGLGTWGWHSYKAQRRLKQLAEYDSLTGLFSRGHFNRVAESALSHALTLGAPVSCILFDVDLFKGINDKYGHSTGDWALKQVAQLCKAQLREYEIFGRIGGEEFCLILPECDLPHASAVAEKLRRTLESCDTQESGYDFSLTASFGVTDTHAADYSMDKLLAQADKAMYQAKRSGRNQVQEYCANDDSQARNGQEASKQEASQQEASKPVISLQG